MRGARRVLFVLPFLHFGVGRLVIDLMQMLADRGVPVALVTCGRTGDLGDDSALLAHAARLDARIDCGDVFARDAASLERARSFVHERCDEWNVSLVHAFTAPAAHAALGARPVVASVVGWSPQKLAWQRAMDAAILARCDAITVVSRAVEDDVRRAGLRRPTCLVANGVAIPEWRTPRMAPRPVLGFMGQLIPRKGADVLLDALAQVPPEAFDRLRVAGDGAALPSLCAQADSLGLESRIEWLGHADVDRFLASIDLLVVPSRSDALPMVLLQAMATGVPVIASRTDGIPEVLDDGVEGLLVEPGAAACLAGAIRHAVADRAGTLVRAERARRRIESQFSVAAMCDAYLAVYAALDGRGRPAVADLPAARVAGA